jgi:hypothetical protein
MIIKYKQKRVKNHLIFGMVWFVLGIIGVIFNPSIFTYGYLLIGLLYIIAYFFENRKQYLTIENDIIIRNTIPKKSFDLKSLTRINRNSSGIKLISETSNDLLIRTPLIEEDSLRELKTFLKYIESKIN